MDLFNDLSGTEERCPHLRGAQARAAARLAGRVVGPEAARQQAELAHLAQLTVGERL